MEEGSLTVKGDSSISLVSTNSSSIDENQNQPLPNQDPLLTNPENSDGESDEESHETGSLASSLSQQER